MFNLEKAAYLFTHTHTRTELIRAHTRADVGKPLKFIFKNIYQYFHNFFFFETCIQDRKRASDKVISLNFFFLFYIIISYFLNVHSADILILVRIAYPKNVFLFVFILGYLWRERAIRHARQMAHQQQARTRTVKSIANAKM